MLITNNNTIDNTINNPGTISFQILALQKEVANLSLHLDKNKREKRRGNDKDVPAKRALLKKVAKIRTFFRYLKQNNLNEYQRVININSRFSEKQKTNKNI